MAFVGIDSQALTYLVEAIEPGYDPAADPVLAAERLAMVRSYVYGGVRFWVMPTVEAEYNRIRNPDRHLRHERAAWILLHDALILTLPGCAGEKPNWYFAAGDSIYGPYTSVDCGWMAGSYSRETGRRSSACWKGLPEPPGWVATMLGKLLRKRDG